MTFFQLTHLLFVLHTLFLVKYLPNISYTILNNWKVGLTQKKRCRKAAIVLSILMKNGTDLWNLAKQKLFYYTKFFKPEYLLLWPMVNFPLKVAQTWGLSSEIQGFEASTRWPLTIKSRTTNIKSELLLGGNWL